jgi:hypothetical protein
MSSTNRVAARRPRTPRPKPERHFRWLTAPTLEHRFGIARVQVGKEPACCYLIQPIASDFGRAVEFRKLDGIGSTVYHVLIQDGPAGGGTCDCRGFEAHDHCKHRDLVLFLLARGELPPPCVQTARRTAPTTSTTNGDSHA